MKKFTMGSKNVPLPIHLDLKPITKALDKNWWGGTARWKTSKVNRKQRNLAKALREYPRYVRAKRNKGNKYDSHYDRIIIGK